MNQNLKNLIRTHETKNPRICSASMVDLLQDISLVQNFEDLNRHNQN